MLLFLNTAAKGEMLSSAKCFGYHIAKPYEPTWAQIADNIDGKEDEHGKS